VPAAKGALLAAALLTTGRHSVANLRRPAGPPATDHRTGYQRVLSAAPWSALHLACLLTAGCASPFRTPLPPNVTYRPSGSRPATVMRFFPSVSLMLLPKMMATRSGR